jgi:hypothetical protein
MQPLASTDLRENGVPEWAVAYIFTVPLSTELLDLSEACDMLQIRMLSELACARIAAEVMKNGKDAVKSASDSVVGNPALQALQARDIKTGNKWAWIGPDTPVVDSEGDVLEAVAVTAPVTAPAPVVAAAVDAVAVDAAAAAADEVLVDKNVIPGYSTDLLALLLADHRIVNHAVPGLEGPAAYRLQSVLAARIALYFPPK